MIEIVSVEEPKKLDITPEMALSAARVLRDFCDEKEVCDGCTFEHLECCGFDASKYPCTWSLPERGNLNGKAD